MRTGNLVLMGYASGSPNPLRFREETPFVVADDLPSVDWRAPLSAFERMVKRLRKRVHAHLRVPEIVETIYGPVPLD